MRFVLFDRIVELEKGKKACLLKNVSQSEDFFIDHFPGYPVLPGSVLLGSFEQGAEVFLAASYDFTLRPVLQRFLKASFRHLVLPGDQIEIRLTLTSHSPPTLEAVAYVRDKKVADAWLEFALNPADQDRETQEACDRLKNLYAIVTSSPLTGLWEIWGGRG